jgi:hypothetical protein
MDRKRPGTKKVSRKEKLELLDPTYSTGMMDGYARAIASMNQSKRDEILHRVLLVTK